MKANRSMRTPAPAPRHGRRGRPSSAACSSLLDVKDPDVINPPMCRTRTVPSGPITVVSATSRSPTTETTVVRKDRSRLGVMSDEYTDVETFPTRIE